MKLSGSTFALLASLVSGPVLQCGAADSLDYTQRNEKFSTTAATAPAGVPTTAVRPAPRAFALVPKTTAPGLGRFAPAGVAETAPKHFLFWPVRHPAPRTVNVLSPAGHTVHFWHWRSDTRSPLAAGFEGRLLPENVYPIGRAVPTVASGPAPGLDRFVFRSQPPPAPAPAGGEPAPSH